MVGLKEIVIESSKPNEIAKAIGKYDKEEIGALMRDMLDCNIHNKHATSVSRFSSKSVFVGMKIVEVKIVSIKKSKSLRDKLVKQIKANADEDRAFCSEWNQAKLSAMRRLKE